MPDISEKDCEFPHILQDTAESLGLGRPIMTPDIAFQIAVIGVIVECLRIGMALAEKHAARQMNPCR